MGNTTKNQRDIKSLTFKDTDYRCIGNTGLLKYPLTGFLCSRKCPAATILETHETVKKWANDPERTIVSGFHSPVEQECMRLLIRGKANIIYFPAREIDHLTIRKEWQHPLNNNRMLIITLASIKTKQMSSTETDKRNQQIAALSHELYIPYATPGGLLAGL